MSKLRRTLPLFMLVSFMVSCATHPPERAVPVTVVVGPLTLEAPVTKSTQIHTFEQDPDREFDRQLLPTMIDDIEVAAQRFLTEELAKQPGIRVVPFDLTAEAGEILEVRPCREDKTAAPASSFSWASMFDLLL